MRTNKGILILAVLIIGFLLGIAASAFTAERHPEIHRAQNLLGQAKSALEHAAHDYAGHRVKAIEDINQAQDELRLALESDRK